MKKTTTAVLLAALLPGVLYTIPPAAADTAPPKKGAKAAAATSTAAKKPVGTPIKKPAVVTPPADLQEIKKLLEEAPKASAYPNAAKATLLDLADITVRPDGSRRTITRQTIKVFNIRGRDDEAEVKIPYNSAYETVKILKARTIKPDGTMIDVRPSEIRQSRPSEYDDAVVLSFSMPAVDNDCVIDYQYETVQKESMMPGQFWSQWYFQGGFDPVMYTKLTVTVPKGLKLGQQLKNTDVKPMMKDTADGKSVVYTWEDRKVAPLETEPMMPDPVSVLPTLHLSTVPSWQSIADWYWTLAKDRMVADESIKARAIELTKDKKTPEEKAEAIFYYVQDKTRYVAIELGISAYQPRPALSVLTNQYGDCKDMTTLLVAMLREVGITAHPVLLEAGDKNKKNAELPSPGAFNHAICLAEIGGKKYWLDATAQVCPWGVIPSADRGCDAFVIREGKGTFETIPMGTPEDNRTDQKVALTLAKDGSASGTVTLSGTGDVDMGLRSVLAYLPDNKLRPYLETQIAQKLAPNARVTGVNVSDFRDKEKPVTITMNVTFPNWAKESGDLLIFNARPEQTSSSGSSPFREDIRLRDITQQKAEAGVSTLELTLPEKSTVLSLPKPTEVKSDLGRFQREIKAEGNKITILTRGEAFPATVPARRYEEVRKYYDSYLKAADESVVIKKG